MKSVFIPTEDDVLKHAELIHGENQEAKESFITAVWLTVYHLEEPKNTENA